MHSRVSFQKSLKRLIAGMHNKRRNLVAAGKYGQPKAANMRYVRWSSSMATRAQA